MALSDYEILQDSRGEEWTSNFIGTRVFAIPTGTVESLRNDWTVHDYNVWPGSASAWSATHGVYAVGDKVLYSVNGYAYKCVQQHTADASKPPTNVTYWIRIISAAYIRRYKLDREFPGRPGFARVQSWYMPPPRNRILRDNPGKGWIETDIDAAAEPLLKEQELAAGQTVLRQVEGPLEPTTEQTGYAAWSGSGTYLLGARVLHTVGGVAGIYRCTKDTTAAHEEPGTATGSGFWTKIIQKMEVVDGNNQVFGDSTTVYIAGAAHSAQLADHIAKVGKTNANRVYFGPLGWMEIGSVWYMGARQKWVPEEDDLWMVTYVFLYTNYEGGWPSKLCTVQRLELEAVMELEVGRVQWAEIGARESRLVTRGAVSFSDFEVMLVW